MFWCVNCAVLVVICLQRLVIDLFIRGVRECTRTSKMAAKLGEDSDDFASISDPDRLDDV